MQTYKVAAYVYYFGEVLEQDVDAPPIKSSEYKVFNRTSFRTEFDRAINDINTKVEKYLYGASGNNGR